MLHCHPRSNCCCPLVQRATHRASQRSCYPGSIRRLAAPPIFDKALERWSVLWYSLICFFFFVIEVCHRGWWTTECIQRKTQKIMILSRTSTARMTLITDHRQLDAFDKSHLTSLGIHSITSIHNKGYEQ